MEIIQDPQEIERKSMAIIADELGELDCSPAEEKVIKRVVHATADPEIAESVILSESAIEAGLKSLEQGNNIITDVNMLKAGINSKKVSESGGTINCFISDEQIAKEAKEAGITRSMMCMRKAVQEPENKIFVIGNAPTALFELIKLVNAGQANPDLIIGTPVGFVGAKESKLELEKVAVPYITLRGRKGGSAVAASIMNALLYM